MQLLVYGNGYMLLLALLLLLVDWGSIIIRIMGIIGAFKGNNWCI